MTQGQRHRSILELIDRQGELIVEDACQLLNASPATVRRDFIELTQQGLADKTWGGIIRKSINSQPGGMLPIAYRQAQFTNEKKLIAEKAASFVEEGDVIIIDGGTTTFYMAPYLANKRIRVITNSIIIAYQIDKDKKEKQGAEVILTGGILYPESGLLVGPQANINIKQYNTKWAFLSAGGVDSNGPTNSNQLVVETEQAMIEQSKNVILLADQSKFEKRHMCKVCDFSEIDHLITNASIDQVPEADLLNYKVNIIKV
jgi:DeoR/GlpR family transcriptional regulator of sugar metabolism